MSQLTPKTRPKGDRRFCRNGAENGKSAYLVKRKVVGTWITIGTILYDGTDWVLRYAVSGRIERYERLSEAKDAALKI